jgi:DNA mismatch repair ATPase MutS
MKVLLMHPDRDFDAQRAPPAHEATLRQDLALDTLLAAMAQENDFLLDVSRKALLAGTAGDAETISYRQEVLLDCMRNPGLVRDLHTLAFSAIEEKRRNYWGFSSHYPSSILHGAIDVLGMLVNKLETLRSCADEHASKFASRGFKNLFVMLQRELDDSYLERVRAHLVELKFREGVLVGAQLGAGCESAGFTLRRPEERHSNWLQRLFERAPSTMTVRIAPRDQTGAKTLGEMRDRGINAVANAAAQSMDHILGFFEVLHTELAFYVGCLNLRDRLAAAGAPVCLPQIAAGSGFRCTGLRDACLVLEMGRDVVSNTLDAAGKDLVVVTGANQGGKSTFLRARGVAQLMMQAGMFVVAESFSAGLYTSVFTHYKREEDATMQAGKLDEELGRISEIAKAIRPGALLLCNESFASTNEREGSEIAGQVIRALLERGIRVVSVTHLYTFAREMFEHPPANALFLRAERHEDGTRTFKLIEGAPLHTSYGQDLYRQIFEGAAGTPEMQTAGGTSESELAKVGE